MPITILDHIMNKYITIVSKLARIKTVIVIYLFFIIGYLTPSANYSFNIKWIVGFVAILAWYVNATAINDLADEEIDKINLKNDNERPLLDNSKNRQAVRIIYYSSIILTVAICFLLGYGAVFLAIGMLVLNYIYSMPPIRISYRGIWAPLMLPIGYVFYPFMLGFLANGANWQSIYFVLLAGLYLAFVGRLLLKDYRDVKGDKKFGKLTFLVRHGNKTTALTSATCWFLGASLVSVFFYKYWPMMLFTAIFAFAILYFLLRLSRTNSFDQQKWWLTAVGRAGNVVALAVILLLEAQIRYNSIAKTSLWLAVLFIFGVNYLYPIYNKLKNIKHIHG